MMMFDGVLIVQTAKDSRDEFVLSALRQQRHLCAAKWRRSRHHAPQFSMKMSRKAMLW
jgi:hypothetical protein